MRTMCGALVTCLLVLQIAACGREESPPPDAGQAVSEPPAAGQDVVPVRRETDCHLTMGWDPWPPFHYTTFGGELTGFDVELVRAMAAEAGCELEFERDSWAALLGKIRAGSVDLVTGATVTEARQEFAHFSAPVRREEFALFVRVGEFQRWESDNLRTLMERGMRLGITDAYVYDDAIEEVIDDDAFAAQVMRSRFGEANIGRLLDGEIDAFVEDVFAATTMIRRLGFERAISQHRLPLGEGTEVRIMYSKASVPPELVEQMDASLARMKESGEHAALMQRYLD